MTCPRCKSDIPDNTEKCEICGKKIKKCKALSKFKDKKKPRSEKKTISRQTKLKILTAAIVTLALVIVIVFIINKVDNNTGINLSEDIKEYIDSPVKTAINETDAYFADESDFDAVNFLTDFDYVIEDDKDVQIDGVSYPVWAIFVSVNDDDEITSVTYTDFKVLKKNDKGIKTDKEINLDKFTSGEKYRKLANEIDINPFSITYENSKVIYTYKYYFENDFHDEQAMSLEVVYSVDDMTYVYSTSQREVEDWL